MTSHENEEMTKPEDQIGREFIACDAQRVVQSWMER